MLPPEGLLCYCTVNHLKQYDLHNQNINYLHIDAEPAPDGPTRYFWNDPHEVIVAKIALRRLMFQVSLDYNFRIRYL